MDTHEQTITITDIPPLPKSSMHRVQAISDLARSFGATVIASGFATCQEQPSEEDYDWAAGVTARIMRAADGGKLSLALMVNELAACSPM